MIAGGMLLLLFSMFAGSLQAARASTPTPTPSAPGMIAFPDMMVAPVLPENPTQSDYGRQVYYYVCMACHGNLGQGLTEEWVAEWGEDNSCWQSKCHASNHPEEGFQLPRSIPGLTGFVFIEKFGNALVLHDFIKAAMPWQAPGSLSEEEYWQLTAYLIELNGLQVGDIPLDESTASDVVFTRSSEQPQPDPQPAPLSWPLAALAVAAALALVGLLWRFLHLARQRQGQ